MQRPHRWCARAASARARNVITAVLIALATLVISLASARPAHAAPVCFDVVGNIVPCDSSTSSTTATTTTTVAPTTTAAPATTTTTTSAPTTTTAAPARQVHAAPAATLRPPSNPGDGSSRTKTYVAVAAVSLLLLFALVGPELRAWSRRRRSHGAVGS
jgi:hypothetical protein